MKFAGLAMNNLGLENIEDQFLSPILLFLMIFKKKKKKKKKKKSQFIHHSKTMITMIFVLGFKKTTNLTDLGIQIGRAHV